MNVGAFVGYLVIGLTTTAAGVLGNLLLEKRRRKILVLILVPIGLLVVTAAVVQAVMDKGKGNPTVPDPSASIPSTAVTTPTATPSSSVATLPTGTPPGGKRLTVRLSPDDHLPQAALVISPPKLGVDFWRGDFTVECITEGKGTKVDNCEGEDDRKYFLGMIEGKEVEFAEVPLAALTDTRLCREDRGAGYAPGSAYLDPDHSYCVLNRETHEGLVVRIVSLPKEQQRPVNLVVDLMPWSN